MKTKALFLALAVSLFAIATSLAAPGKIQVDLSISPDKTLPGLSVPLKLRVRNGARAFLLGPSVRVHATSPDGHAFFAKWEGIDTGELELGLTGEEDDDLLAIPANATVDLEVPAVSFTRPSWALDPRILGQPGEWTLQVYLYTDDLSQPVAISNPAKFVIQMPSGRDVPVWEAVRRGEFWAISQTVLTEQPHSAYYPYLATTVNRRSIPEKIAIIRRAIELHPNSPVVPYLRYALASYYDSESGRVFFNDGDLEKAVALAERGRTELETLRNGKNTWGRLRAKAQLGRYPSREYFASIQRLQREKGTKKP